MSRKDEVWQNRTGGYIETISPTGYDVLINGTNRYLNFNNISGTSGYGFRDNSGVIQFKNNSGSWANIGASITGSDTQVLFFDGDNNPVGNAGLTFDKTLGNLGVKQNINFQNLTNGDPHSIYIYSQTTNNTNGNGLNLSLGDGKGVANGGSYHAYMGNADSSGTGSGGDYIIDLGAGYTGGVIDSTKFGRFIINTPNIGDAIIFDTSLLTSSRTFAFPDQAGTFALTSDIPSLSGYLQNNIGISGGTTLIGGTDTTDNLIFKATSGVGTTSSFIKHLVGTNGSVETMREGYQDSPDATATGGTITTVGGYTIHTFTSGGTFTVSGGTLSVDYLIVAGGGGGGGSNGGDGVGTGGGGAGGKREDTGMSVGVGAYTVTVGAGGTGGASGSAYGTSGGDSSFNGITSTGGGYGASSASATHIPASGGSGGGSSGYWGTGGAAGTAGQGNSGGTGKVASTYGGGGGGGAGGTGSNGTNTGGAGGVGSSSSISGSAVTYATGGAGGTAGIAASSNATANRGEGGAGTGGNNAGRNGSSGVVIIRYLTSSTTKRPVIGINKSAPTAQLHIGAGAGNQYSGQLQFDAGILLSTPIAGTIEYKTGAFVLQSDALLMGGGTSLLSTETLSIQKNQSGLTYGLISNTTSATTAQAAFQTLTNGGLGLSMRALSPAFTTSGINVASTSILSSNQLAGLNIGTTSSTQLSFWTNNTERARFLSSGEFLVGQTSVTNSEFVGFRKDQNALTMLRVHNATSGTAAKTMQGTSNATSSIFLQVQSAGFTSSGMEVADTAAVYANAVGGLNIGTYNATQTSFWTNSVERARFLSTGEFGIGTTAPTAILHLKAGSDITNGSPFKFTSGTLTTGGNMSAGAMEFLTDSLYYTTTTGTKRRMIVAGTTGRATAQTAANTSVATYTLGATDASYEVSANVLVTTSSAENFTVTVDYTDEGNTARTVTLNFQLIAGTIGTAINFANGAVPYEGIPLHIRCKASTAITVKTTGTFTGATYNVEGIIKQTA